MVRHTARTRGVIAVAAFAATALTLTACSGSGGDADGGGEADTASLVIGLDADQAPQGYDPLLYSNGQRFFFEGMYDSLFEIGEDGSVVPSAATDFSFNEDFTQMTLDVDTTLTFDDGTALSADLVKENLDQRDNPDLNAYRELGAGGETEITDVEVVDEDTLTLTFAVPQPGFQGNLAFPGGAIVGPTGLADRASLDTVPDGSGPLTVDSDATIKGNSYVLVKKDGADRAADYPFDSYEFKPILDPQARTNALISGEVEITLLAADTTDQVESSGKAVALNGGTIWNLFAMDKAGALNPAFGDPLVAKALSIAINRPEYVAAVHPGQEPTWNVLPADSPGFIPELEDEYAYDPEAAKDLLAEAGYADGLEFEWTIQNRTQRDLEALQTYWAAIGVDVTLNMAASTEELFAAVRTNYMGGPLNLTWSNPLGNINGVLFGFANFHGAEGPEIQAAAQAYGAAQDDAARAEALTGINRAIVDSGWLIPLYEEFAAWGYEQGKVAEPTFAGAEAYPILASIQPAS
ncbi:ABC transporter substrate-binding protein [Microbacter sp. GSS18]|nr:ABC transporter substrate-binding protein [Microbacter sp. GSS18]